MSRGHYSERFKITSIGQEDILLWVTDDLDDEEIINHFEIAMSKDNFEYAQALYAEAQYRGLKITLQ